MISDSDRSEAPRTEAGKALLDLLHPVHAMGHATMIAGIRAIEDEAALLDHEHYWVDAPDDETGWHCTICGRTEYPGDPGIGEAVSPAAEVQTVLMAVEVMEQFATRDQRGNAIRWEWGGPDIAGIYTPTLTVDYSDNLVAQRNRELAEKVLALQGMNGRHDAIGGALEVSRAEVLALIEDPAPSEGGEG